MTNHKFSIEPEEKMSTSVNVTMPPSLRHALEKLARARRMKLTPFTRALLRGYVEQHGDSDCQSKPPSGGAA